MSLKQCKVIVIQISVSDSNADDQADHIADILDADPSFHRGYQMLIKDSKVKTERRFHHMRKHGLTIEDFRE